MLEWRKRLDSFRELNSFRIAIVSVFQRLVGKSWTFGKNVEINLWKIMDTYATIKFAVNDIQNITTMFVEILISTRHTYRERNFFFE